MKLKIKVTKDILRKSMWCGISEVPSAYEISTNCAIALAVKDVFPNVKVYCLYLHDNSMGLRVWHSLETAAYIRLFDDLINEPEKRLELPEYEFEIELTESVIQAINIDGILKSETLELVQ